MLKRAFEFLARRIIWGVGLLLPIQKNKIVITSFGGKGYCDNPKYIVEELLRRNKNYKIIWIVESYKAAQTLPLGIIPCKINSAKSILHMSTAKVWIDNCRKIFFLHKKKKQYYIQTWHGDFGFKKAEKLIENQMSQNQKKKSVEDSNNYDLFLVGTKRFKSFPKEVFWYNGETLEGGYPRRDLFFGDNTELIKAIRERLNLSENQRVFMYAPTFRKYTNASCTDFSCYNLDWGNTLKAMEDKFGGEWVGLFRFHPGLSYLSREMNLPDNVIDVSEYPDMQELMLVADFLISDYSSCLLEFGITEKPSCIFALDYEYYKQDRGTSLELDKLHIPFAQSNAELADNIRKFDVEAYQRDLRKFNKDIIGFMDDGNSSSRVADIIDDVIAGKSRSK